ncbi:SelT/SelW/selH family protein [Desmospora sp. 8437]|nr:SelT/SelW/selH family protein [Desmospora sp. 8437]
MAEELFTEFRHRIADMTLIPSSGGIFEVTVDGEKIYSKKETGRHAEEGEVVRLLREKID